MGFLLYGTYLQKNLWILTYVLDWLYSIQYLTSFSSIDHLLHLIMQFHLTQMSFSQSTHLLFFLFGDFNIHHKNWPSYYGGDLVNFVITFLSQMALLRWLTFLLRSLTVTLTVLLLWISFFLLMLVFVLKWLFHHWEILIMLLCKFLLTFHQTQNRMACFTIQLMAILVLVGMVLVFI